MKSNKKLRSLGNIACGALTGTKKPYKLSSWTGPHKQPNPRHLPTAHRETNWIVNITNDLALQLSFGCQLQLNEWMKEHVWKTTWSEHLNNPGCRVDANPNEHEWHSKKTKSRHAPVHLVCEYNLGPPRPTPTETSKTQLAWTHRQSHNHHNNVVRIEKNNYLALDPPRLNGRSKMSWESVEHWGTKWTKPTRMHLMPPRPTQNH